MRPEPRQSPPHIATTSHHAGYYQFPQTSMPQYRSPSPTTYHMRQPPVQPYPPAPPPQQISPLLKMPLRKDKTAPSLFKGKYSEVTRFIKHYNRLLEQHHVEDDDDRCEGILEYCSRKVRDFITSLGSYQESDYPTLQADILKYYDADREEARIRPNDLVRFLQKTNSKSMQTLSQWRKYYRDYTARAGFLRNKNRISELDYLGYFWYGIPERVQDIFHEKLSARHPDHDMGEPWPVDKIVKVADTYFNRSRFTDRLLHLSAIGIDVDSEDSEDSDTDSESDESDSDSEYERRRTHKKKKVSKKKLSKAKKSSVPVPKLLEEERTRKVLAPADEIEGIIQQLNTMSIDDPKYGFLYYKATRTDNNGKIAQCIRRRPQQEPSTVPTASSYQTQTTSAASYPNNVPLGGRPPAPHPFNGGANSMKCYGCFDTHHMLGECPKMAELIQNGTVSYDSEARKYRMPDGRRLYRQPTESIIDTIERMRNNVIPAVHFVTVASNVAADYSRHTEEYESDDDSSSQWKSALYREPTYAVITDQEYSDGYDSPTYQTSSPTQEAYDSETQDETPEHYSFNAERRPTGKKTTQTRVDAMRAPYNSTRFRPIQDGSNNADRRTRSSGPIPSTEDTEPALNSDRRPSQEPPRQRTPTPTPSIRTQRPTAPPVPTPISPVPEPIPINVRQVRFNPDADVQMAEPSAPRMTQATGNREANTPHPNRERARMGPRQSELATQVAPAEIVHQILDTEISIPVRKLLGASKEVSAAFQDVIKPKSAPKPTTSTSNNPTPRVLSGTLPTSPESSRKRTEETLIKLDLKCNGRPISAIVDTGAMLNIVNENLARHAIRMPIDLTTQVVMGDANGGQGVLTGLIRDIPLTCGDVHTTGNLYVGQNVPYDLLLGRPWQKSNKVCIDERNEGTFLVFKNRNDVAKWELLVTECRIDPHTYKPIKQVGLITVATAKSDRDLEIEDILEFEEFMKPDIPESETMATHLKVQSYDTQWLSDRIDPLSILAVTGELVDNPLYEITKESASENLANDTQNTGSSIPTSIRQQPHKKLQQQDGTLIRAHLKSPTDAVAEEYPKKEAHMKYARLKELSPRIRPSRVDNWFPAYEKELALSNQASTIQDYDSLAYKDLENLDESHQELTQHMLPAQPSLELTSTATLSSSLESPASNPPTSPSVHSNLRFSEHPIFAEAFIASQHADRVMENIISDTESLVQASLSTSGVILVAISSTDGSPDGHLDIALENPQVALTVGGHEYLIQGELGSAIIRTNIHDSEAWLALEAAAISARAARDASSHLSNRIPTNGSDGELSHFKSLGLTETKRSGSMSAENPPTVDPEESINNLSLLQPPPSRDDVRALSPLHLPPALVALVGPPSTRPTFPLNHVSDTSQLEPSLTTPLLDSPYRRPDSPAPSATDRSNIDDIYGDEYDPVETTPRTQEVPLQERCNLSEVPALTTLGSLLESPLPTDTERAPPILPHYMSFHATSIAHRSPPGLSPAGVGHKSELEAGAIAQLDGVLGYEVRRAPPGKLQLQMNKELRPQLTWDTQGHIPHERTLFPVAHHYVTTISAGREYVHEPLPATPNYILAYGRSIPKGRDASTDPSHDPARYEVFRHPNTTHDARHFFGYRNPDTGEVTIHPLPWLPNAPFNLRMLHERFDFVGELVDLLHSDTDVVVVPRFARLDRDEVGIDLRGAYFSRLPCLECFLALVGIYAQPFCREWHRIPLTRFGDILDRVYTHRYRITPSEDLSDDSDFQHRPPTPSSSASTMSISSTDVEPYSPSVYLKFDSTATEEEEADKPDLVDSKHLADDSSDDELLLVEKKSAAHNLTSDDHPPEPEPTRPSLPNLESVPPTEPLATDGTSFAERSYPLLTHTTVEIEAGELPVEAPPASVMEPASVGILGYGPPYCSDGTGPPIPGRSSEPPSPNDYRIFLHPTFSYDATDTFAYGGLSPDQTYVKIFDLPLSRHVRESTRPFAKSEVELMTQVAKYLNGDPELAAGVPIPDLFTRETTPGPFGFSTHGSWLRLPRFPRVEEILASITARLVHRRLGHPTGRLFLEHVRHLVTPGFPQNLPGQRVRDVIAPDLPYVPVDFSTGNPDETNDHIELGFTYFGCLERREAILLARYLPNFHDQLYYSASALFETLQLHSEEGLQPPPINPFQINWQRLLAPYPFNVVFKNENLHQVLNRVTRFNGNLDNRWLDRIPYVLQCCREITRFIYLLETFFFTIGFTGLRAIADSAPLNTYLDYNHSEILDTEEAVYLTAAYDFFLREHQVALATKLLHILLIRFPFPYQLALVRHQIIDSIEPAVFPYSLYNDDDIPGPEGDTMGDD